MSYAGTLDPAERSRLDGLLKSTLDELELPYERTDEGAYLVELAGEHKLKTMTWLIVQDVSLRVEAFFMRKPAENEGGTYRFLLDRNARTYGVHFSVDRLGDIYLSGRLPLQAVTPEEIDRVLGCVREYSDGNFDQAIQLGFKGAIERERAWRAKLAAETRDKKPEDVPAANPLTGP